jgi:ATP-binding cassette subfamily B protein
MVIPRQVKRLAPKDRRKDEKQKRKTVKQNAPLIGAKGSMLRFSKRNSFVWKYLAPEWASFAWITAVLFLQILFSVLAPLPFKFIFNHMLGSSAATLHEVKVMGLHLGTMPASSAVVTLTGLTLAISVGIAILSLVEQLGLSGIVFRSREAMRRDLFARLFTRRQIYLDSKKKIDLLGRVSGDVENTEILMVNGFAAFFRDIPIMLVLVAVILAVNPTLGLIFCFFLPIATVSSYFFASRNRQASKQVRRRVVFFEEETHEALSAMAVIKSLRAEPRVTEKLLARVEELTKFFRIERNAAVGLDISVNSFTMLSRAVFVLAGSLLVFGGKMGWGDLIQVLAYMELFARHVNNLTKFLSKAPKCLASVDRLEELSEELGRYPELSGKELAPNDLGNHPLQFRNVGFRHPGAASLLDNFSHDFPHGGLIAVVGQSGIGKSTFSRLLNRLIEPTEGEILLGKKSLKNYAVDSVRSAVLVVSQESFLLSGSVRENLSLAKPCTTAAALAALTAVNALDFVQALPAGLDTIIGEGGLQLSGGQAKRVHLARAFLAADAAVLLFDEPTTGLDTLSAEIVMASIRRLAAEKSLVFWITHRMQEVAYADQVLFFSPGESPVVESPLQLLKTNSRFRSLMEEEKAPTPVPEATL